MTDQTQERRPDTNRTANSSTEKDTSSIPPVGIDPWLDMFLRRVIVDALNEASAAYWERRADVLEDAAPRPGEFHGRATRAELSAAWRRCMGDARRCRAHAELLRDRDVPAARDDWDALLGLEAAA